MVYDPAGLPIGTPVGGTSREHSPSDPHIRRALEGTEPGAVEIEPGEVLGRFGKDGEEIVEFALPLVDSRGEKLGALVFSLARGGARLAFFRTVFFMLFGGALVILLFWYSLYRLLNNLILKPILELSEGIKQVRAGDLSARVGIYRRDEIGTLVESFNDLIAVLVERDSLQARLEEANRLAEAHRRLNEAHQQLQEVQERLILNEKHASLGRLVHGLNHELNNPLSAAQNMIPPLEAALLNVRQALDPPPPPEPEPEPAAEEPTSAEVAALSSSAAEEATPPSEDEAPQPSSEEEALESGEREAPEDPGEGSAEEAALANTATSAKLPTTGSSSQRAPLPPAEPLPPPVDPQVLEDLEDATQAVEVLGRSVKRAINIVRDLGEFSRLTTADLEEVELLAVVEESIAACEGELGERVSVAVDVPEVEGEPMKLRAFPHLLTQVFVNLITNSAQAIEGSGKIRIWARRVGDGRIRIELDDNGPGIPKESLHKVFEPFFTTKEQGRGTGLGLSICLGVVEKHGGTIEARKKWRGAHFVIELPLEPVIETGDPFASTSILASAATKSGSRTA
ncbi:MAG TPA: hypothetical protein DEA08_05080 [Planctomycetes bacterium]|nr:hypothetical protein [Planctomycetota bacterium]